MKYFLSFYIWLAPFLLIGQDEIILSSNLDIPGLNHKNQFSLSTGVTYREQFKFNGSMSYSPINHLGLMINSNVERVGNGLVGAYIGSYFYLMNDSLNKRIYIDGYGGVSHSFLDLVHSYVSSNVFSFQSGIHLVHKSYTTISLVAKLNVLDVQRIDIEDPIKSSKIWNEISLNDPYVVPSLKVRGTLLRQGLGGFVQLEKHFYKNSLVIDNKICATIGITLDMGLAIEAIRNKLIPQ